MAPYPHTLPDIGSASLTMMMMMKYVVLTGDNNVDTWKVWAHNHRSLLLLSSPILPSTLFFYPLLSSNIISSPLFSSFFLLLAEVLDRIYLHMDYTPLTPQLSSLEDRHKELDAHDRSNHTKEPTADYLTFPSLRMHLPEAGGGHR